MAEGVGSGQRIIRALMKTSDFDYELPDALIARYPLARRDASRLLHIDSPHAVYSDRLFAELPGFFRPGDLLVFNDTRVIKARKYRKKATGGKIEALVERVLGEHGLVGPQLRHLVLGCAAVERVRLALGVVPFNGLGQAQAHALQVALERNKAL